MRNLAVRGIYVSLALLTFFAVFVGTVGAREALASRTQAIRQTIAANPALSRTITVNSTLHDVQGALASESLYGPPPTVTPSTISAIGGQLHRDFDRGVVTLSPTAQAPVPPPVTLFDLGQTVPLALAVAVLPALAAALVIFRRPDPAAELRAAEVA